ncbi:MAG: 5-amino-6-(D-ribitylamino)uracil--L-tyrosine 4-hydroxyphenyl transferase CofH [Polyangiaceae bacterium]|nr:5-amino-6-(D-ribitylamino)uracil--L-tyrosine 4-hydroxyphenyl transferase CofH [Polyangiaceae bacterium]
MSAADALLPALLGAIDRPTAAALEAALEGREVPVEDALLLTGATGAALHALCLTADALRARQAGDVVTYVVNRNINFTNVCIKHCGFCAFSREHREEEGYFLDVEEVLRRATEARDLGATEVCLQAGMPPGLDGRYYVDLCRAIKRALPDLHVHAFSPEEVLYGAVRARVSVADYLAELREAGLGSLPGTSAEILDDGIRGVIAKGRITTAQWIEVVTTAHRLGIRTTSTMMYGHVETPAHQVRHMDLLRRIQKETGGFTEFVPLSFVHHEAPMALRGTIPGLRDGATGVEVVRVHAIARLMLGETLRNIQASWVKDGLKLAQWLLSCGASDLGGTLINESISTTAGAAHGQLTPPRELRRAIREAGRVPAERTSLYALRRVYGERLEPEEEGPLDRVRDAEQAFGSYRELAASPAFRFVRPRKGAADQRGEEA